MDPLRRRLTLLSFGWLLALLLCLFFPAVPREGEAIGSVAMRLAPFAAVKISRAATLVLVLVSFYSGWVLAAGRAASSSRSTSPSGSLLMTRVFLGLILAAGILIRFYGLPFSLPATFHPDESSKAAQVLHMLYSGKLEPFRFFHPPLLLYCTALLGRFALLLELDENRLSAILLAGRAVSVLAGVASILLIYFLARRLSSRRTALVAAALFAFAPLSVTCSRYLKEDSLLVALVLLTAWLWVTSLQRESFGWLLASGLAAGMTVSAKYTGLLALALIATWPWAVGRRWIPARRLVIWTAAALGVAGLGFLLITPFVLTDPSRVFHGFVFEARHAVEGHFTAQVGRVVRIGPWSQWWMYHLGRSVVPGLTLLPAILGLVGLGILARRRRMEDLFILGAFLLFLLPAEAARSKPYPQPERYVLPALPFLCLAGAEALRFLRQRLSPATARVLLVLAVASPLLRSLHLAADLAPDTRDQLVAWTQEHLPSDTRMFLDNSATYSGRFPRRPERRKFEVAYGTLVDWKSRVEAGFTHLVESSFASGRFLEQPNSHRKEQDALREMRSSLELVKEFRTPSGPYGFHNPVLRLYRVPELAE